MDNVLNLTGPCFMTAWTNSRSMTCHLLSLIFLMLKDAVWSCVSSAPYFLKIVYNKADIDVNPSLTNDTKSQACRQTRAWRPAHRYTSSIALQLTNNFFNDPTSTYAFFISKILSEIECREHKWSMMLRKLTFAPYRLVGRSSSFSFWRIRSTCIEDAEITRWIHLHRLEASLRVCKLA